MSTQLEKEERRAAEVSFGEDMEAASPRSLLDKVEVRYIWGRGGLTKIEIRRKMKPASERGGAAP